MVDTKQVRENEMITSLGLPAREGDPRVFGHYQNLGRRWCIIQYDKVGLGEGRSSWSEYTITPEGVHVRDVVGTDSTADTGWALHRTNCFCCSCDDPCHGGWDPHCRNHGADGSRACERHNMPAQACFDGSVPSGRPRPAQGEEPWVAPLVGAVPPAYGGPFHRRGEDAS